MAEDHYSVPVVSRDNQELYEDDDDIITQDDGTPSLNKPSKYHLLHPVSPTLWLSFHHYHHFFSIFLPINYQI